MGLVNSKGPDSICPCSRGPLYHGTNSTRLYVGSRLDSIMGHRIPLSSHRLDSVGKMSGLLRLWNERVSTSPGDLRLDDSVRRDTPHPISDTTRNGMSPGLLSTRDGKIT